MFPPVDDLSYWARSNGLLIVLVILGAVLVARFASWSGARVTRHLDAGGAGTDALSRTENVKHWHALTQVVTWIVIATVYCVAAAFVVELLGVPFTGFVAPATVIGVALGFGAQQIVADILAGFFLISERQYGFGDMIRLNVTGVYDAPVTGSVEEITLRVTRIRSLNGEVVIVRNGLVNQVTNLSRDWARAIVDVPIPSAIGVDHAGEMLRRAARAAFENDRLSPLLLAEPTVAGVESLDVDHFEMRVIARTLPGKQFEVARGLRAVITSTFAEAGVMVSARDETARDEDAGQTAWPPERNR